MIAAQVRNAWDRIENPVMGREFRARMRGARSYWITGLYAALVALCVLAAYASISGSADGVSSNRLAAELGRGIWTWGCVAQAMLIPLLVPAFTCGAITLERERDLLELLLLTRQSVLQICLGKLGSGVGLGVILVLSSVPVLSLAVLLGGISPGEVAASLTVLLTAVLASGALGLAASTVARKTVQATLGVYLVVGSGLLGLPLLLAFLHGANSLADTEAGILAMLGALMAAAFPPAIGIAFLLYAVRKRRTAQPPPRVWWIGTIGVTWAALLLVLYVPGATEILLSGEVMLLLHPVVGVLGLMSPDPAKAQFMRYQANLYGAAPPTLPGMLLLPGVGPFSVWHLGGPLTPHLWWLCSGAYTAAAAWLFLIAVLRVRRLRAV